MDKYLKIGVIAMLVAVVLVPLAILLKPCGEMWMFGGLIFAMLAELIGLVFVILSMVKKKSHKME
ncbi:hypothetical protein D9M68_565540 [compost metagenome]